MRYPFFPDLEPSRRDRRQKATREQPRKVRPEGCCEACSHPGCLETCSGHIGLDGVQRLLDNIKRKAAPSVEGIKSLVLESYPQESSLTRSSLSTSPRTGEGRAPIVTPNDKGCRDWEQADISAKTFTPDVMSEEISLKDSPQVPRDL